MHTRLYIQRVEKKPGGIREKYVNWQFENTGKILNSANYEKKNRNFEQKSPRETWKTRILVYFYILSNEIFYIQKIYHNHIFFVIKNALKIALQYVFNVIILFKTVFLFFLLKIEQKTYFLKT